MPSANGQYVPFDPAAGGTPATCAPPADSVDKCDVAIFGSPDAPGETSKLWPLRLNAIIDACQPIGTQIREGNALTPDVLCSLLNGMLYPPGDNYKATIPQDVIRQVWSEGWPDHQLGDILGWWTRQCAWATTVDSDRALNVLAVRAVVMWLVETSVHGQREQSKADSRGLSLGFEAFKIGVAAGSGRADARAAGLAASIRPALVYAVEILDQCVRLVTPHVFPSIGEAIAMFMGNTIDDGQLRQYVWANGGRWPDYENLVKAARRKPEVLDAFTLRNREVYDDRDLGAALQNIGFTSSSERVDMAQLRYEVPGPADLVRFAVRHVFEPDLIAEFGYDDEYRPVLDAFHHAQGVDYPIFTGPLKDVVNFTETANRLPVGTFAQRYADQQLPEPTWARAYWWSHWVLPSPTQGYEMMFRLAPDRDKTGEPAWLAAQDFDLDHLRLLLRANDYPPYWRDKLAAIAFRPPNLRFLRVQLQTKSITEQAAVSQLRQMGFSPAYAATQAKAIQRQLDDQEAERLLKIVLPETEAAWEAGIITDAEFFDALSFSGIPAAEASAHLAAAQLKRNTKVAKELTSEVQRAYLRGVFSWNQAGAFLDQIGITQARITEYHRIWDGMRQARTKEVTQGQLRKSVVDGGLSLPNYAQRLRNLDYADSDIELLLHDARLALTERQTRALQQLAAESEKTERARLLALRRAEQLSKQLRSDLSRHGSPGKLKTWYCNGDISSDEVTQRLITLGWPQPDIDRLLGECDAKREKQGLAPYSEEAPGSEA